jgi:hypothetical protein
MVAPSEVVTRRSPRWAGRVPTFTGIEFSPITPKAEDVNLLDIARGLACKYRYGGHSDPLITVAEHSVLVVRIIDTLWPESGQQLAGLLHDACEAYTQDLQSPIRQFIKVQLPSGEMITWGDMERRVNTAVAKALGISQDFYSAPEVAAADMLAVSIEKAACPNFRPGKWGVPTIPSELKSLKLQFLAPAEAQQLFLDTYQKLTA